MNTTKLYKPDETGYLSQEGTKSYYSRIGFFAFFLGAISLLVAIITSLVLQIWFPWMLENSLIYLIINCSVTVLSIYCIAMPVALLLIKPLPKIRPIKEKLNPLHFIFAICVSFFFLDVGQSISQITLELSQKITGEMPSDPFLASTSTPELIINAAFTCLVAPILEEILFRRLLCNRLLPLGEKKAIVISAAIFGLIHGNFYQFAYAFLIGLVFGYIYVKTGRVIYTIIIHAIINFFGSTLIELISLKLPAEEFIEQLFPNGQITLEAVEAAQEQLMPYMEGLTMFTFYVLVNAALVIAGGIIFFILTLKRKINFEQGILQTPREHRFSNFFLTGGVAAAIGYFVVSFLLSIVP